MLNITYMVFLPEHVWYLGHGDYILFIKFEEQNIGVFVNTLNPAQPPYVKYYENCQDKDAHILLIEGQPETYEMYEQDFRVNWNFDSGILGVLGRPLKDSTHE